MNTNCPRCKAEMRCEPEAIQACPCSQVTLDESVLKFLALTSYDCLCNTCLETLSDYVQRGQDDPLLPSDLQEGLHYYREGRFFVFTEYYHVAKGYCCENDCRHCAYGRAVGRGQRAKPPSISQSISSSSYEMPTED